MRWYLFDVMCVDPNDPLGYWAAIWGALVVIICALLTLVLICGATWFVLRALFNSIAEARAEIRRQSKL